MKNHLRDGSLNTFEQILNRAGDALASLILLRALAPEAFGKLALAQAIVAPLLFFFLSPESILFRELQNWQNRGRPWLKLKLFHLRVFAWLKIPLFVLLSAALSTGSLERFYALIWAFSLVLTPQTSGVDREFLRLELKFFPLTTLTFLQKGALIGGTVWAASSANPTQNLAWVTFLTLLGTTGLSFLLTREKEDTTLVVSASMLSTWKESFLDFSIWNHIMGVIQAWVQTLDLFLLGLFGVPPRSLGLYSAALKFASLATSLPLAASNYLNIKIAHTQTEPKTSLPSFIAKGSVILFLLGIFPSAALYFGGELLFPWLTRGQWQVEEIQTLIHYFGIFALALSVWIASHPFTTWINLRGNSRRLLLRVYLPWGLGAGLIYFLPAREGNLEALALSNLGVSLLIWGLVLRLLTRPNA